MFPLYFIITCSITLLCVAFLVRTALFYQDRTSQGTNTNATNKSTPFTFVITYISLIVSEVIYAYLLTAQDTGGVLTVGNITWLIIIGFGISVILKSYVSNTYTYHLLTQTTPTQPASFRKDKSNIDGKLLSFSIVLLSLCEVPGIMTLIFAMSQL